MSDFAALSALAAEAKTEDKPHVAVARGEDDEDGSDDGGAAPEVQFLNFQI